MFIFTYMKIEIEQRQTNRFTVLYEVYKATSADTTQTVDISKLAADKNIKNGKYKEVIMYLRSELLLSGSLPNSGNITHSGVKIVEFVVTNPDQQTEYFPSFNDMGI